jgi:DNA-binding transcriptional regulator YiaG
MKNEYESEVLMVCHQSAESLLRMGIIDADEMREFDEGCLTQKPESEIEKSIKLEHVTALIRLEKLEN